MAEGIQPTVFSTFLANSLTVAPGDRLAVDAGAGGGILAITLALLGMPKVIAIDRSDQACELVKENAKRNGVADQIEVRCGDLHFRQPLQDVDLVVCNPPTIPERPGASTYISGAGPDGTDFLDALLTQLAAWLGPAGRAQIVLSSLVDAEALEGMLAANHLRITPDKTLIVPIRSFYYPSYGLAALEGSLQSTGQVIAERSTNSEHLNELVTVHMITRR